MTTLRNQRKRGMSFLLHGHSKVGKTTLALTGPYPRLLLDAEAAAHLLPNKLVWWDPFTEPMPIADGSWDTCVVDVDNFEVVTKVYEILKTGMHQFKTLVIDSISELQSTIMKMTMRQQDWGLVLAKLSDLCRNLRDLPRKRNNPIEMVVLTAMTKKYDTLPDGSGGIYKPYLQGQISSLIPYWYDVTAYYFIQPYRDPNTGQVTQVRRLLTGKNAEFEAGNRVHGMEEYINYPNLEQIIDSFFGPSAEAVIAAQDQKVNEDETIVQSREKTVELSSDVPMSLPKINK
jgi:hypothetical protein